MNTTKTTFTLTVLASSLMAAYGTAWSAEDDELAGMIKPSSSISIGVGHWDKDRPKFGTFDAMRDSGGYLLLDADVQKRDDATGTWKNLYINSLGTDNREIRFDYLQQGNIGGSLEYNEFRSRAPYTINTNQTGIGTNTQTTGANITVIGSGSNHQFGTDRSKLGVSVYKNLMPNLDFNAKFSSEDKQGNRITTNGSDVFVADLIDWTTQKAEATLDYTDKDLQLSGGLLASWFKNNNSLGFINLGNGATRMTQPLDNSSRQAFASGSYSFTPTAKGTFKLAYTQDTQNEALPTAGIASAIYTRIPSLQGKVNTTLMQLGLTAKPLPKFSVVANLRYQNVQDKTPQYTTVQRTDNGGTLDVNTTPYSYKTTSGKLEGTYSLAQGYSVAAGVDYSEQDRTVHTTMGAAAYQAYVPMRENLEETTYRLQVRKSLSESLNGSLTYLQGNRDGSNFTASTRVGTLFVSPVNTADRERRKLRLAMDWAPIAKLDLQLNVETAQDDYGNNARSEGLHEGTANLYNLDVSYQLSDAWQISGWYSRNTNDAHFINDGTAPNRRVRKQNDTGDALGLNLIGKINSQTKIGAELTWSNDRTNFEQSNTNGTATGAGAPDIFSKALRLKLFADYALRKDADLRFDLIHERWSTDDWQWNYSSGLPWQYGAAATDGTTVITTPRQNSTFVGARYIYKFQ
ncbi:MAG: MtrB/PioB family decaheme-associated outer membrane protein [Sulfuritalea sp.]|nr:MtrB/PioB family decaheme-associated outer membrane protein [Sulfuritalea sp.]